MKVSFINQTLSVFLAAVIPLLSPNISWGAPTLASTTTGPVTIDPSLIDTTFLLATVNEPPEPFDGFGTANGPRPQLAQIVAGVVVLILGAGVIIIGCKVNKKLNPKPPAKTNNPPAKVTMSLLSGGGGNTTTSLNTENIYAAWIQLDNPADQQMALLGTSAPDPIGSISFKCASQATTLTGTTLIPASEMVDWTAVTNVMYTYGVSCSATNSTYGLNGMPSENIMNIRMVNGTLTIGAGSQAFTVERGTITPDGSIGSWQKAISVNVPANMTVTFIDGGNVDESVFYRTVKQVP